MAHGLRRTAFDQSSYDYWTGKYGVVNVKDYGAIGDGVHDDTAAIQAAIDAVVALGGGRIFFPPGTYVITSTLTTPNTDVVVVLQGAARDLTIIQAAGAINGYMYEHWCNGGIEDMTWDGNAVANSTVIIGNKSGQSTLSFKQYAVRATLKNTVTGPSGSWVFACWDENQTFQVDTLWLRDVLVEGPSQHAGDAFAVSYVDTCYAKNISFRNLYRSPNFYYINQLFADGLYTDGCQGDNALTIDAGVLVANVTNVTAIPKGSAVSAPVTVNAPEAHLANIKIEGTAGTLNLNVGPAVSQRVYLTNPHVANGIEIFNPLTELTVTGGYLGGDGNDSAVVDNSPANSVTDTVILAGIHCDAHNTSLPMFRSVNGTTWTRAQIRNCTMTNYAAPLVGDTLTLTHPSIAGNIGYNPVGSLTAPAVPASGTAQSNTFNVSVRVYVAGGTVTNIAVNGTDTSLTGGQFLLEPGETITLTYTAAPTWTWFGL